jgi:hypothetical protein
MLLNFDSGALEALITKSCIQKLRLRRDHANLPITGLNMFKSDTTRGKTASNLLSRMCMENNVVQVNSYIVSKITCNLPITSIDQSVWSTFKDLELADLSFHQPNKFDVMYAIIKNGKIQCGNEIAQNTTFGWVFGGRAQVSPVQPSTITTFHNIAL